MNKPRVVCWFSCGAASAIATKLAIKKAPELYPDHELVIATIYLEDEHPDSMRFKDDCAKWFGQEIIELRNEKYNASVDEVIRQTRYMSGVYGARCTKELKKQVRIDWQRDDDVHVFGMDANEAHRIDQLIDHEPEIELWAPLIDEGWTKERCFFELMEAGIALPKMYELGYNNNNCIGCLKAQGAGYWNKIRADFPDAFNKRAEQERLLDVALCKMSAAKVEREYPEVFEAMRAEGYEWKIDARGSIRMPLRFLPPDAGTHKDLDIGSCGFFCEQKELFG